MYMTINESQVYLIYHNLQNQIHQQHHTLEVSLNIGQSI